MSLIFVKTAVKFEVSKQGPISPCMKVWESFSCLQNYDMFWQPGKIEPCSISSENLKITKQKSGPTSILLKNVPIIVFFLLHTSKKELKEENWRKFLKIPGVRG